MTLPIELQRVLAIPRAPAPGNAEKLARRYLRKRAQSTEPAPELFASQARMMEALEESASWPKGPYGAYGAVLAAGCGHGKTLVSILAPTVYRAVAPALVVPAARVQGTLDAWQHWRQWYEVGSAAPRVISYESLSQPDGARSVAMWSYDLLVCDEAHYLSNRDSARWMRVARYLSANRDCRLVVLSGTMLRASLLQIGHLWSAALKERSPLPVGMALSFWSIAADPGNEPTTEVMQALSPIAQWAGTPATRDGLRTAIASRVYDAPGVAHVPSVSCDASLTLRALDCSQGSPEIVQTATRALQARWELPDGEPLTTALEFDRASCTVPYGHWHRAIPPVSEAWLTARAGWLRVVRKVIAEGLADSPATAREYVRSAGGYRARVLEQWEEVEEQLAPRREHRWLNTEAREWLCNAVRAAMACDTSRPWVIWYRSRAVGVALAASLRVPLHGTDSAAPVSGRHCVVSSKVHGTGWNGQAYSRALFVEPHYSASEWQQILARHHRPGQADDVLAVLLVAGPLARASIARAEAVARFIEAGTKEPQRLLFADRDGAAWRLRED